MPTLVRATRRAVLKPATMRRLCGLLIVGLLLGHDGSRLEAHEPEASLAAPLTGLLAFEAPVVLIRDVGVIDGTGGAVRRGWSVLIEGDRIKAVGPSRSIVAPANARIVDGRGQTLLPGLVGMHQHLFGFAPARLSLGFALAEQATTASRLYLAAGVTTARTAGSISPYQDLLVKQAIAAGREAGPDYDLTGPYLDGGDQRLFLNWPLKDAEDATDTVDFWARHGFTSFKAYDHITPEELKAAIVASHAKGSKITGHLCTIGFTEAAEMGIDNLEHGLLVDTEFLPGKKPGVCPPEAGALAGLQWLAGVDVKDPAIQRLIRTLVARKVAITSTLAVFEAPDRIPAEQAADMQRVLAPDYWREFATSRAKAAGRPAPARALFDQALKAEMAFEREFVRLGGLLMAGCDPTGSGNATAGFGDQRQMELLVAAGFSPAQAVQIYTANGAAYLGRQAEIGTIAPGKKADMLLVGGDFATDTSAIRRPIIVFKGGRAWDPVKLRLSVTGYVGVR